MRERDTNESDELERLRRILLLRAKETLLGSLLGNFLHDLNNPLAAISGNAELLLFGASDADPKAKKRLDSIQSAAGRISEKLHSALFFAKPGRADEEFDLNRIARNAAMLAGCLPKPSKISISLRLSDRPAGSIGNPNQLAVALLVLLDNALDAAGVSENPFVEIETREISDDELAVSVVNNGPEIEESVRARLFEPFFSTKKNSLGLGLCVAQSLVSENNGEIDWSTSPTRTEFRIVLRKKTAGREILNREEHEETRRF